MYDQIEKAFAALDTKLIASDQEWAIAKLNTARDAVADMETKFKANDPGYVDLTSGYDRFCRTSALARHFGSKAMMNLLYGHGHEGALANMKKNTRALITKRNANIVKALTKKEITTIAEFELTEHSDGYEGYFEVDGHKVTIRTVLAGGYNVQRLHQRTLIKIR